MTLRSNRCQLGLQHHPLITSVGVSALIALTLLTHFAAKYGLNSPPSATGDEPSYDSIGWQISRGNGFREDFTDPEFRRPYDQAAESYPELMTLPAVPPGTVSYRPPLFPGLIAVTDLLWGRQFLMIRGLNIMCLAAVGGLLWHFLARRCGVFCAVIGLFLFLAVDVRTRLYARAILTESLAALLTTLLTLLMLRLLSSRRCRDAALLGIVGGLMMLNRTAIVLWLPGLGLGMTYLLSFRPEPVSGGSGSSASDVDAWQHRFLRGARLMLLAGVMIAAVYGPWGYRNCRVLGRFMPLGTQGQMELSAAFSERAWQNGGVWFPLDQEGFFRELNVTGSTRLEREVLRADFSRDKALDWVSQHPEKAAVLGLLKILHEYRPRAVTEWGICLAAVVGLAASWRSRDTHVFLLVHFACACAIAATWSVEGRFVMPLLFSTHVLAATGVHAVWCRISPFAPGRIRPFSRSFDPHSE